MKSILSIALALIVAYVTISPKFKETSGIAEFHPIEELEKYNTEVYNHKMDMIDCKTDSIKGDIRKDHSFIENVVPGAN